jgi:ribosomal protein S18 acetylase RimI-like enzyme
VNGNLNTRPMNEGISVRTCSRTDVDTLVSIGIKTFRDTFDEFNTPDNMLLYINENFTKKAIEREMKEPGTVFFLAFDGRKSVGYAKLRTSVKPEGLGESSAVELERIYVHKEYIGKRVGFMLMQSCLSFAKKRNCEILWLGVWENNARAISFYEKYGFAKFGQHSFVLGNDEQTDWLMQKIIK